MHPLESHPIPTQWKGKVLSILLPFLNEEDIIVENTRKVLEMSKSWELDTEVILIDDGSTDQSFSRLTEAFSKHPGVRLVHNHRNFGKGWALKTGFEFSRGELVLFLDADLELSPLHLPNFLHIMDQTRADVVIGSKLHPDSRLDYPLKRKIMSKVYYLVTRILFGLQVKDTQTGIKLFRRSALEIALPRLVVKRFAFDIELLLLMLKYHQKVESAPIELNFSRVAAGRMKLSTVANMLWDTMAIFYRDKILRFYERPMGPNRIFSFTFILFSHQSDEYEKSALQAYLSINYPGYKVIYCGPEKINLKDDRLTWVPSQEKSYLKRLEEVRKRIKLQTDYVILSTLETYPDERFLYPVGRLLSQTDIQAVGGFLTLRNSYTDFEMDAFTCIRSVFLNARLSYRYRALHPRPIPELPLEGMIIPTPDIMELDTTSATLRLEHVVSATIRKKGGALYYVPDLMLYKRFPIDWNSFQEFLKEHAFARGQMHNLGILGVLGIAVLLSASLILSILFKNVLISVPLILYISSLYFSRLILFGFLKGHRLFILLIRSQLLYSWFYLKGFFKKS